jgi:hypothetical protein
MAQPKKIAVLVRGRESEALRMALGLTLMDDVVDVYVLDHRLASADEDLMNLDLMGEVGIKVYSNHPDDPHAQHRPTEEIARQLLEYDHVLPY